MDGQEKVMGVLIIATFTLLISLVITDYYKTTTAIEAGLVRDSIRGKTMWVKPKETK